jgi:hypothetical protein
MGTALRTVDREELFFHTQAQVRGLTDLSRAADLSIEEQMAMLKERAPDPSVFDEQPPFTWSAEASNGRLDFYYSRMDDKSLKNYVADATDGVMFLDSHVSRKLGYGQSFYGTFTKGQEGSDDNPSVAVLNFFTIPNMNLNGIDTNSFINGARSGVLRDVSIGFIPGSIECNICGADPYDWWDSECIHVPGAYYDKNGKMVDKPGTNSTQAFAWMRNSRLLETSAVYDGATPGAHILKAQFLAERGEIERSMVVTLERRFRCRLPEPAFIIEGSKLKRGHAIIDGVAYSEGQEIKDMAFKRLKRGVEDDTNQDSQPAVQEDDAPVTDDVESTDDGENNQEPSEEATLNEEQAQQDRAIVVSVRRALSAARIENAAEIDPAEAIGQLSARITELTPLADQGRAYRVDLINETLDEGVRAFGNAWARDTYQLMLEGMTNIDHIKRMRDDFKAQAAIRYPSGRATAETNTDPPSKANGIIEGDPSQFVTR